MESVTEIWKDVKGREGMFQVSDQGRVKVLPWERAHWCGRSIPQPESIAKQSRHSGGYMVVSLRDNRKHYVHKLVMAAFVGEAGDRDVNHIDGDKKNNRLDNLEYCDRLHNVRHAVATGLQNNAGEGNGMHKLTAEQVVAAHGMVQRGHDCAEVAGKFGVSASCIEQIAQGVRWKHLGLPALI